MLFSFELHKALTAMKLRLNMRINTTKKKSWFSENFPVINVDSLDRVDEEKLGCIRVTTHRVERRIKEIQKRVQWNQNKDKQIHTKKQQRSTPSLSWRRREGPLTKSFSFLSSFIRGRDRDNDKRVINEKELKIKSEESSKTRKLFEAAIFLITEIEGDELRWSTRSICLESSLARHRRRSENRENK